MERRTSSKADWKVGWDDLGRARLQWADLESEVDDSDSTLEKVIEHLCPAELTLEEDARKNHAGGFDPYDHRPSWAEKVSDPRVSRNKKPPAWT